ncbi:hypothetical protein [Terribacillus sp. 7520-G]|uniref:hypothetical protein n=1 Tax=Terribacillus sp. 7520-G TaxID=2025389 RepID=UPI00117BE4EC|nr:hypothetical protein [Terribacillus sp. 7520-G]
MGKITLLKKILALLVFLGAFGSAAISVQAAQPADYTDSTFTFAFSGFDENDNTNARRKGSSSSMYIKNTSSYKFSVEPQADAHYGKGTDWVRVNNKGLFPINPGKKYEVYNTAYEDFFDGVQVRFHGHMDLWYKTVKAKVNWSPDYNPESGTTVVGL